MKQFLLMSGILATTLTLSATLPAGATPGAEKVQPAPGVTIFKQLLRIFLNQHLLFIYPHYR